jgi:hypothetical protein
MCLTATDKATRSLKREMKAKGGKIVVYKMVRVSKNQFGLFIRSQYQKTEIIQGWNVSDRVKSPAHFGSRNLDINRASDVISNSDFYSFYNGNGKVRSATISKGIHVYLNETEAKKTFPFYDNIGYKLVKFEARIDDLVAAGTFSTRKSAVFNKVFLTKKEYNSLNKKGR